MTRRVEDPCRAPSTLDDTIRSTKCLANVCSLEMPQGRVLLQPVPILLRDRLSCRSATARYCRGSDRRRQRGRLPSLGEFAIQSRLYHGGMEAFEVHRLDMGLALEFQDESGNQAVVGSPAE